LPGSSWYEFSAVRLATDSHYSKAISRSARNIDAIDIS